jgi:hypothetical protein
MSAPVYEISSNDVYIKFDNMSPNNIHHYLSNKTLDIQERQEAIHVHVLKGFSRNNIRTNPYLILVMLHFLFYFRITVPQCIVVSLLLIIIPISNVFFFHLNNLEDTQRNE